VSDTFEDNKKRRLETDERMRQQQVSFQQRQTTRREIARDRDAARRDKEMDRPERKYVSRDQASQTQDSRGAGVGKRNYKAALVLIVGIVIITTSAALLS
jgi:hypothetical protein